LLIDKIAPWEKPIPCAEGVGRRGLEEAIGKIDPSWIRLAISRAVFQAPCGASVSYTSASKGFIIDRAKMQKDLAARLRNRGAEIALGLKVRRVSPPDKSYRQITLDNGETLSARVVIDASGPVSLLGKGENICWKPYDLEPACFVIAENIRCEDDAVRVYAGQKVAPGGGYAWVFPRGGGAANIGIVIGKNFVKGANLKTLLDDFLKQHFPDAQIITRFAGSIPCGYRRGPVALPGLIKCGDAANAVNPISRAGIVEAMMSGGLAGAAALDMLGAGSEKQLNKICKTYEKRWYEKRGARHLKLAKVKSSLSKVPDADYDRAAQTLQAMPPDKISMAKIFGASMARFPRLAWALRHLM
jgi:flavin-dependent dehydrogenase